jgi:hypothetical protein
MGIARSTYYGAARSPTDDTAIAEAIAAICEEFECYGWRRVRAALRQQGMFVNHKKIKRLSVRCQYRGILCLPRPAGRLTGPGIAG